MARYRRGFNQRVATGPGEGIGFLWPSGRGNGASNLDHEARPAKKSLATSSKNAKKKPLAIMSKKSLENEISKLNNKIVDAASRDNFSAAHEFKMQRQEAEDVMRKINTKKRPRAPKLSPEERKRAVLAVWVRIMQFLPSKQLCRCILSREIFRQSRAVLKHCDFSGMQRM